MSDYDYAIHSLAFTLLRALDLWTTWKISPDLLREVNPLYRVLGWRWTIVVNLEICAFAYRWPDFYWCALIVTAFVICWNIAILIVQPWMRLDLIEKLKKMKFRKRRLRMKLVPLKQLTK